MASASFASRSDPASRLDPATLKSLDDGLSQFRAAGFPGDDAGWIGLRASLLRYLSELELWNPKLGLVEATGVELVVKHILDSLAPLGILAELLDSAGLLADISPGSAQFAMADIGSGAGLPGIPLLLAVNFLLPQAASGFSMTLVEKQQRRVGFLLNAKAALGLRTLSILQEKLEDIATARYDLVCARAFSPLEPKTLAHLRAILSPTGGLFLYKGRMEKIREELTACGLNWADRSVAPDAIIVPLKVPFLEDERHLVLIP